MGGPLDIWLGAMYRADVMGEGSWEAAVAAARKRLAADQSLRAEAERLRVHLRPVVKMRGDRVHVERKQLEYLDMLLGEKVDG